MGVGLESGIYVFDDGGEIWCEVIMGFFVGNMGKIGLVIFLQNLDVVYVVIEENWCQGGVYCFDNWGESWILMFDMVLGGIGFYYYMEFYVNLYYFDYIILVFNMIQIFDDGGVIFWDINNQNKYVDDYVIVFYLIDLDYMLVGLDGGFYEMFDGDVIWCFIFNLLIM